MKKYKRFEEAKQVGNIYHYTTIEAFEQIIKTNRLGLTNKEQEALEQLYLEYVYSLPGDFESHANILPPPRSNTVFFSRTPNNTVYNKKGVLLIIDGDKLSNNYKIKDSSGVYHGKIENEIHVPKIINNINKYLIGIIINKNKLDNFRWGYDIIQDEDGRVIGEGDGWDKFLDSIKQFSRGIKLEYK